MSVQVVLADGTRVMMGINGDCLWLDSTLQADGLMTCATVTVHFTTVAQARELAERILQLTAPREG